MQSVDLNKQRGSKQKVRVLAQEHKHEHEQSMREVGSADGIGRRREREGSRGREVYLDPARKKMNETELPVSAWPTGLYR